MRVEDDGDSEMEAGRQFPHLIAGVDYIDLPVEIEFAPACAGEPTEKWYLTIKKIELESSC